MTIIYVVGKQQQIEDLIQAARIVYLQGFKAKYPTSKTEIEKNHKDRRTGVVSDREWQLAVDGKTRHSDRLDDYIEHPNPVANRCIIFYDDTKTSTLLNIASYYNPTARKNLGANKFLYEDSLEGVKALGFFPEEEAQ